MITIDKFKELFLKLTEYTIPFGYEETLEPLLPQGYKQDSVGNYYYEIGQSETLFTTHLDTYSKKYVKIKHVIDEYVVATDGKTILGGDNKLGTAILINMVNERKPGTYFFFLGEEPLESGGLYGSRNALKSNPEYFSKFKRCIAFDRKEYGSIVTRQMGRNCCSMEFATAVAKNLKANGIDWDKTVGFGYYTDTATFMDVIPEVTNLSAGGFREHHTDESVDLEYTYSVLNAALKIDWESLPVVRELEEPDKPQVVKKFSGFGKSKADQGRTMKKLNVVMDILDLSLTRSKNTESGKELTFSKWLEEVDFKLIIDLKGDIVVDGKSMNYSQFMDYLLKTFREDIVGLYNYYAKSSPHLIDDLVKGFGLKNRKELVKKLS